MISLSTSRKCSNGRCMNVVKSGRFLGTCGTLMNVTKSEWDWRDLFTSTQSARFSPLQYFLYAAQNAVDFDRYTRDANVICGSCSSGINCSSISSDKRRISSIFWNSVRWSVGEMRSRRSCNADVNLCTPYWRAVTKCCSRFINWYRYFRGASSTDDGSMDYLGEEKNVQHYVLLEPLQLQHKWTQNIGYHRWIHWLSEVKCGMWNAKWISAPWWNVCGE